jgi:putative glycosyl hydrolase-like family 15 (GHL15) protein
MRVTPVRAAVAAAAAVGVFAAVSNAAGTGVSGLAAHRSPTNEAPVLEWKRLRGAIAYRVVRDGRVLGRVTTTSFTDEALATSGLHTYVVRGVKSNGSLTGGDRVKVIVDALPPTSMSDRPSADSLTGTPQISWNAVGDRGLSGIKQYNVRRDGVYIGSVGAGTFTFVDERASEGRHEYIVRAQDAAGNRAEDFSPAVAVTVDRTAPETPAGLTATRAGRDVQLKWKPVVDASGIAGYRVLRNGEAIASPDNDTLLDTPPAGDTYGYRVIAVDRAGNASEPSEAVSVTIDAVRATDDTTGRMAMQANLQMWGARVPDAATAIDLATRHDLITGVPGQFAEFVPEMRAANPNLRLFAYLNGMFAQSGQGSLFPESWYMRDAHGSKLQSTGYGNYLMDPRATTPVTIGGTTYSGWTDWVRRQCKQALERYHFDGCFLDMLGAAPLSPGYLRGREAVSDSATNTPWVPSEYIAVTGSVGRAVEDYVGKGAIGNGLGWGGNFYSVPTRALLSATDISLAEVWMRSPGSSPSTYPRVDRWKQEVQMLIDANRAGDSVEATIKVWTGASAAQQEAWRSFGQASFLIGNSGSSWLEFSPGRSTLAWHDRSDLDGVDLGAALDTYASVDGYLRDGVYQRRFTQGIALVNPGDRAVTVDLEEEYRTPGGDKVKSVTLEPHSGQVLLAR